MRRKKGNGGIKPSVTATVIWVRKGAAKKKKFRAPTDRKDVYDFMTKIQNEGGRIIEYRFH